MTGKFGRYMTILGLLVFAIIALAAGMLVTLLETSAERLDKQQLATEGVILNSVVKRQLARLESNVTDYGLWDEMYDRFAFRPDAQWDIENLGPYGAATFQIEHVAVLGPNGILAYDYDSRGAKPMDMKDLSRLNALAMPMIADARAGRMYTVGGVMNFDGMPHYVVMHAIGVASEKRKLKGDKPNFALVYMKAIDSVYLSTVASDFNLHGLRAAATGGMVPLAGPRGGAPAFGLSWNPSHNGRQFISDSVGMLLTVSPIVVALILALGFGGVGMLAHARDAEMRTARARVEAAEETSKAKSLFLANMSHELRTPLNAINGFSEFVKNDMLGLGIAQKYKEYAADIHESGQHLLRIVNNLLLFSKIEAKQHKASIESLALGEEIASSFRMLSMVAQQRNVGLVCAEIPRDLSIKADQQGFVQIVVNVVANAVKFSPEGSEVRIEHEVVPDGNWCDLKVVDHGCGIPKTTLAQLGEPFVQAEGVYTRRVQGTGLGLAICFKLAEQMGGKLTVESEEGKGTVVTLRLPLASSPKLAEAAHTPAGALAA